MSIGNYLLTRLQLKRAEQDSELALERERRAREAAQASANMSLTTQIGKSLLGLGMGAGEIAGAEADKDLAVAAATAQQRGINEALDEGDELDPDLRPLYDTRKDQTPLVDINPADESPLMNLDSDLRPLYDTPKDETLLEPVVYKNGIMEGLGTPKVGTVDDVAAKAPSTAPVAAPAAVVPVSTPTPSPVTPPVISDEERKQIEKIKAERVGKAPVGTSGWDRGDQESMDAYKARLNLAIKNKKITKQFADALMDAGGKIDLVEPVKETTKYLGGGEPSDTRSDGNEPQPDGGAPVPPSEDVEAPEEAPTPPIDVTKPVIIRILEQKAPAVTKYTPPKFTKDPRALATRIVEEVWAKRPVGNPLTEFFNKNRTEAAKQLAIESVMGNVVATRQAAVKSSFERWREEQKMVLSDEQLQVRSQLAEAQALLANAKANKTTLDATIKKPLGGKDRDQLEAQIQLHKDGGRLTAAGKKLLFKSDRDGNRVKGDGIPLGGIRQAAMAANMALGSITSAPNSTTAAGGNVGVGAGLPGVVSGQGGVSGSSSTSGGGAFLDDEKFNEAWAKIDMNSMSRDQQEFMGELKKTIQTAGKSREGKSLTDKDLAFYMKSLVSETNPSLALININRLMEDNAESYGRRSSSLSESVTSGMEGYMKPLSLDEKLFTQEEIDGAFESDPSEALDWADRNRPKQPGDSNRAGFNKILDDAKAALGMDTKEVPGRPGVVVKGGQNFKKNQAGQWVKTW